MKAGSRNDNDILVNDLDSFFYFYDTIDVHYCFTDRFIVNRFPFYKGFQIYVSIFQSYDDSLTSQIQNCFIKDKASTKSILYLKLSQRSSLWS